MKNEPLQPNILKDELLLKIKNGEVKMRPKAFFIFKVGILIFVAFMTFVITVFLVSYIWFNLRTGGSLFLLSFGKRGLYEFLIVFPWLILLVDILLVVFLDWLLKRFRFCYHNPVLYVFLGTIFVITISGSIVNLTSFHGNIMRMVENKHAPIPGVEGFYSGLRQTNKEHGIFRGEIIAISETSFVIRNDKGDASGDLGNLEVVTPLGVDTLNTLKLGDNVFVAGDLTKDGKIKAYGIKKLTTDL